ncbi:MAG: hypothetical protein IKH78_06375 [Ruminococcus sp.]|nr:hypothetical protein [Ruminococcus sp.]
MENTNVAVKDKNVRKVNTLGLVSKILLNISLVLLIIGIVACIAGGAYFLTLPNDAVAMKGEFTGKISVSDKIPENVIRIEESDIRVGKDGEQMTFTVDESRDGDTGRVYDINLMLDKITGLEFKTVTAAILFIAAISLMILVVIVIFGRRLAKALEKCDSPFEENVIRKMKAFGFSLIPWAVFKLVVGNLGGLVTVIGVLVVLLFISVFNYGAKLQKESDETL